MRIGWRRRTVGLDIGSSAVKAVELRWRRGASVLAARGMVPLPAGAVESGRIVDAAAVASAVRRVLTGSGFRARRCALAVARQAVIVRRVTLPAMSAGELDAAIHWEAQQHIPFPLAEVVLDYHRLPPAGDGRTAVLLVAARRDRVAEYAAAAAAAGCRAAIVDTAAFALLNAWQSSSAADTAGPAALLDVGATSTGVVVALGGQPLAVRELPLGTRSYVEALRATAGLGAEDAERIVHGEADAGGASPAVQTALQSVHAQLAAEVNRALDPAREQAPGVAGAVALGGGGAHAAGLTEALASTLQVPVTVLDPFRRVACNDVSGGPDGPRAAVAVGLALRREGDR